jgi:hypothetical protein
MLMVILVKMISVQIQNLQICDYSSIWTVSDWGTCSENQVVRDVNCIHVDSSNLCENDNCIDLYFLYSICKNSYKSKIIIYLPYILFHTCSLS